MMKPFRVGIFFAGLALIAAVPLTSAAQDTRALVGVSVGSYTVDADAVEGTVPSLGLGGSFAVNEWLDIEGEFFRPTGSVSRHYEGISFSLAGPGASREEIERLGVFTAFTHERRVPAVLSVGASFHPRPSGGRIQPRLFVGTTTHFVREQGIREPLSWPATTTLEEILRHQPRLETSSRALGALTFGGSVAIALTRQLVLMPDVRYDYGSMGEELNNTIRVSMRVLYRL